MTVSETKEESLAFFKRKGFQIVHKWVGRYIDKVTEYLLKYSLEEEAIEGRASERKVDQLGIEKLQIAGGSNRWIKVIPNAHWGDIHGLKLLSDGTIVSGSKDNSLCKWNKEGKMVKMVHEVEPSLAGEKEWITAMGVASEDFWVSGDRSGRVSLWSTDGDFIRNITPKLPKSGHVSNVYNQKRVTCFAAGLNPQNPALFIGFPTLFDEYSWIAGKTVASTKAHDNDWVYCIHPLSSKIVLTATAATLQSWEKQGKRWVRGADFLTEGRRQGNQRPFISSMAHVGSNSHHLGLTLFGGGVKVLDISQKSIANEWNEHQKRVWTLENISENTFATSSEDKTTKFWDIRLRRSVKTISHEEKQMHALLKINENTLIAGSDAHNLSGTNEGAHIFFYDLRQN